MVVVARRDDVATVKVVSRLDRRYNRMVVWAAHAGAHGIAIFLFVVLTLARAPEMLRHPASTVTPDLIDPVFYAWSVASTIHRLGGWHDGLWLFFDANIYYPTLHAASYTDVAVGLLPISLLVHVIVGNPIALLNILTALSFVLSAYGAFVLGIIVTKNYWAGVMAGLVFGFCPLRAEHLGHLNILSTEWLIIGTICVVIAWRRNRLSWWICAGVFAGLGAVSNLYYLAYLSLPILIVVCLIGPQWTRYRMRGALLMSGITALFIVPFIIPYATRRAYLDQGYGATSVDVLSFLQVLQGRPLDSAVLPAVPLQMMQPSHGFFPGFIAVFLALVAWKGRRGRLWAILAGACAILALGPSLQVNGHVLPVPLPYAVLNHVVPYFTMFRDPPRALIGFYLGLAIVCAWGMRDLLHALPRAKARIVSGILIVGLMALELWSPIPVRSVAAIPAGELWLAHQPRIKVVLELPIVNATPLDWQRQSEIMYDSTAHWKTLLNGSSSVEPVGMVQRRRALNTYPSPASMTMLRQLHVDAVALRLAWLTPIQRTKAEAICRVAYRDAVEEICVGPWSPISGHVGVYQ